MQLSRTGTVNKLRACPTRWITHKESIAYPKTTGGLKSYKHLNIFIVKFNPLPARDHWFFPATYLSVYAGFSSRSLTAGLNKNDLYAARHCARKHS